MTLLHHPEFDEETHSYTILGRKYPSVTEVISAAIGANPYWTEAGREAGRATHYAIRLYFEKDLDFSSLPEETKPRLEAYTRFVEDYTWRPNLVERPLYHPSLLYCGTPDSVEFERAVVDFKNGDHLPEHALQLAAYSNFLPNPLRYERWAIQLLSTGRYKLEPYKKQTASADFNVFLGCLNTFNWRKLWRRN
jgi:hypothetical protein